MDNYAAHKHKNVKEWLAQNPRFVVHFIPTHASWMNLVEVWFGIVERQAIRRGVFKSLKDSTPRSELHRRLERPLAPIRLDRDLRGDPQEGQRPTTSKPRH